MSLLVEGEGVNARREGRKRSYFLVDYIGPYQWRRQRQVSRTEYLSAWGKPADFHVKPESSWARQGISGFVREHANRRRRWWQNGPAFGYGQCGKCRTPWSKVEGHSTGYLWVADEWDDGESWLHGPASSCLPLCMHCWAELGTPENRLPYYRTLWEIWERGWKDRGHAHLPYGSGQYPGPTGPVGYHRPTWEQIEAAVFYEATGPDTRPPELCIRSEPVG